MNSAIQEDFDRLNSVVDAFVWSEPGDGDKPQGFIQGFGLQFGERLQINAVMHDGDVSDAAWQQFLAAGFERAAALEVVLGVAAYTLTTFANRLTQAPLD